MKAGIAEMPIATMDCKGLGPRNAASAIARSGNGHQASLRCWHEHALDPSPA